MSGSPRDDQPVITLAHRDAPALTLNLWGHLSGGFGLGEGARCTARILRAAGVRVRLHDLPLATHVNDQPVVARERVEAAAIDLVHTNPNVLRQTDRLRERMDLRAPLRIGYWAWELESFPSGWEEGFAGLDQLWCPSAFTATSLGLRSPIPVSPLPHLIEWDRANRLLERRRRRGLRKGNEPFRCLFAFDFWSTRSRKNPDAVIDAFQLAFPRATPAGSTSPEASLVLKLASSEQFPDATADLQRRCSKDPRIQLITGHLDNEAFDRLYADADALVSLHRAEGFGLSLAEAMAAGLPVVATGYSGNLTFMPPGSAALVPYRLVPIASSEGDYRAGCLWAEPDSEVAAAALRRLAEDPRHHSDLAAAGRAAVATALAPRKLAAMAAQRLGTLLRWAGRAELVAALPADHPLRRLEV
jgi:glycosyltransferase involved in cell wall biosynthesis